MPWPASSSQLAPAVVGDQVWTSERIRNEATPEDARQKWHHNNMAIKYARKFFEEPPGCPTVVSLRIDMREATFEIIECEHGAGELYTIQADGPKYPWSWRAFVNALSPEEAEMVVGPGLVGISLYPRPGSYDHHRAAAAKKHGHEDLSAVGRRFWISNLTGRMAALPWCIRAGRGKGGWRSRGLQIVRRSRSCRKQAWQVRRQRHVPPPHG